MLLSLLYFLVRRLLGAGGRLQDEKEVELLVLRHQVTRLPQLFGSRGTRIAPPENEWGPEMGQRS